jgi:nucleolin
VTLPPAKQHKRKADIDVSQSSTKRARPDDDVSTEAVPTKIFVKNLPWSTTEADLQKSFEECGKVTSIRLPTNDDGSMKGFGFIEFTSAEAATKACAFDGQDYQGRSITVCIAEEKPGFQGGKSTKWSSEPSEKPPGCRTCFLGNLSWNVEEDNILDVFKPCGTITQVHQAFYTHTCRPVERHESNRCGINVAQVRFATDRDTGDFKGFGYIEFEDR